MVGGKSRDRVSTRLRMISAPAGGLPCTPDARLLHRNTHSAHHGRRLPHQLCVVQPIWWFYTNVWNFIVPNKVPEKQRAYQVRSPVRLTGHSELNCD